MKNPIRYVLALSFIGATFSITTYGMNDRDRMADYAKYHAATEEKKQERRDAFGNAKDIHTLERAIIDYKKHHKKISPKIKQQIEETLEKIIRKKHATLVKADVLKMFKGTLGTEKIEAIYQKVEDEIKNKKGNSKNEGEHSHHTPTKKRH